jgi:hypothetical protein
MECGDVAEYERFNAAGANPSLNLLEEIPSPLLSQSA